MPKDTLDAIATVWASTLGPHAKAYLCAALCAGRPSPNGEWIELPPGHECILSTWLEVIPPHLAVRRDKLIAKGVLVHEGNRLQIDWNKLTPATIKTSFPAPAPGGRIHQKPHPSAIYQKTLAQGIDTTRVRLYGTAQ